MKTLKQGDTGPLVSAVQVKLAIPVTGIFDASMKTSVVSYQVSHSLDADGIIGPKTFASLGINPDETTANPPPPASAISYKEIMLDANQYHTDKHKNKEWLFLHHTAGSHNPEAVVRSWNTDTQGRIATEWIIGGMSLTGDKAFDGKIVKDMPDDTWAAHLGLTGGNPNLHPLSIGIEVCNYGYVTKDGYTKDRQWIAKEKGAFYNYVGGKVPLDQVCDLGFTFNGHQHYHKYTDAQIASLKQLILHVAGKYPTINIKKGLVEYLTRGETPAVAFGYKEEAFNGTKKGMLTHTNVRKDKTDMSPQPNLIAMLKSLA